MTILLPYHNTPNYDDTSQPLREDNTASSSANPLRPTYTKRSASPYNGSFNFVNDLGTTTSSSTGYISLFKPQYTQSIKTHRYVRASTYGSWNILSSSDLSQDNNININFGRYIHYISQPTGGTSVLNSSSSNPTTAVVVSKRDFAPIIYSRYG